MSKRAQESKTEEGPAEAKPRPLSLVSRNLLSVKQTSSVHLGAWNRPGHQKLDVSSLSRGTGKPVRDSQDPTMRSQEWQQDDNPFRGARKLVRSGACESSGSTGKPVRCIDNPLERTRLDYHNMQISDYRYVGKVFKNLRQKLTLSEDAQVLDLKTNVLIWGLFVSTTMKASVHVGPNYNENLEGYKNTSFKDLNNLFDVT